MSEEQLKAFLEKVNADTSLQEKLKRVNDVDGVVAIAMQAGFTISADDLKMSQENLAAHELEAVAGGGVLTGIGASGLTNVQCHCCDK